LIKSLVETQELLLALQVHQDQTLQINLQIFLLRSKTHDKQLQMDRLLLQRETLQLLVEHKIDLSQRLQQQLLRNLAQSSN
jgi:hypothetical protein